MEMIMGTRSQLLGMLKLKSESEEKIQMSLDFFLRSASGFWLRPCQGRRRHQGFEQELRELGRGEGSPHGGRLPLPRQIRQRGSAASLLVSFNKLSL